MACALHIVWGQCAMKTLSDTGFSLIEMAITVLVLGMVLAFSIPAFKGIMGSNNLRGTAENIAGQIRLAREKAIATGIAQPIHFRNAPTNDYHIHYTPSGVFGAQWALPRGITYVTVAGSTWWPSMNPDGRVTSSGLIVLRNARGDRDTVSVLASGLVLTR